MVPSSSRSDALASSSARSEDAEEPRRRRWGCSRALPTSGGANSRQATTRPDSLLRSSRSSASVLDMHALRPPESRHPPKIWLVVGEKQGDSMQAHVLASALGWP